ncbi:hypothetical protein HK405_006867 [Cladochytrium tenue]|nr:hypothetical protein HK405_006867 [Cladochytrium tenue]
MASAKPQGDEFSEKLNKPFSGVRARIQLNGSYCFVYYTDQFDITPGCLYSKITDDDPLTGKALVSSSMSSCSSSPIIIDPTVANSSSLACSVSKFGDNIFFNVWGILLLLVIFFYLGNIFFTGPVWLVFAAPYLLVFIIDWVVVLARDARSPEVDLSLVWCPTSDYQACQPVSYAAVHPYAMSQSATWFSTLGTFPLDKIAGYGMVPDPWK